jgi:DNA ligase (NAD+)
MKFVRIDQAGRRPGRLVAWVVFAVVFATAAAFAAKPAATEIASAPPAEQIAALRREIAHHDTLYHRDAEPEITDFEYDQLKERLATLERENPTAATAVPPVAPIGDDRSSRFSTYRHGERMLSLDKTYAEADVRAFANRVARQLQRDDLVFVIEPKFDGFAVSAVYENGDLVRVVTRGNGVEGDDITANARQIRGLPRRLGAPRDGTAAAPFPRFIELRGEVYVSFAEFRRLNAEREAGGETPFANPRNLAAGTIRQLDPATVAERNLEVVFYGIGACEPESARPPSQQALHVQVRAWGLPGVADVWIAHGAGEITPAIAALRVARPAFPFPTDGAVVKLDPVAGQRELGASEAAPRWAVAYKFAPERTATRLVAITLQVGRTGVITPVAELAPVELGGSLVARATLHNRAEIARRDLRIGDWVYVEKAGEIIPAIVGVDATRRPTDARPFEFPRACPACAASLVFSSTEIAVRCPNEDCPGQLSRRVEHFVSKPALDIRGLGPTTIEALVEQGSVTTVVDLYRLNRDALIRAGMGSRSVADEVVAQIDASKRAELGRFIYGLGIPHVGLTGARQLARKCGSLPAFASVAAAKDQTSDPASRAAATYFADAAHRQLVDGFIAVGVAPTMSSHTTKALAGKIIVLTGTLPTLSHTEATARIEAAGGNVASGVTRKTDYLVAGAEPGAKLDRAKTLNVAVIDEPELWRLLEAD